MVIDAHRAAFRNEAKRRDESSVDFKALGRALAEFCDDREALPLVNLMRRLMREMKEARHRQ